MSGKVYAGSGGLWLKDGIKASSSAPRWRGTWTCPCCKTRTMIDGYGADQGKSQSPNGPTIKLRASKK